MYNANITGLAMRLIWIRSIYVHIEYMAIWGRLVIPSGESSVLAKVGASILTSHVNCRNISAWDSNVRP